MAFTNLDEEIAMSSRKLTKFHVRQAATMLVATLLAGAAAASLDIVLHAS